ncbi:YebC/PmpR family DNA-binding transcriptional regulator [Candidatus Nomurabacteria bacterium]|nr:YebC/PmpR family DNA-binding transcriptional regulator [Candidatus Nomurabacteria bacterium]
MAGHNKWTQIKRQKGAEDAKRSKLFGVLSKNISLESRKAGGDKDAPGLRAAILKARAANMPNNNIERAIRGATEDKDSQLTKVIYEAYGPGGVALIIEGTTDNNNRTAQEIKHLLSLHGGKIAIPGSVLWAFQKIDDEWRVVNPKKVERSDQEQLTGLILALESGQGIKKVTTNLSPL